MEYILEIINLSKKFKSFQLKNINLKFEKGVIMGFVGPNGAGKTTVIKSIMGLSIPDSGTINIMGKNNSQYKIELNDNIGFVYEENYWFCLLYTSPSPRDVEESRMPSSA